MDPGVLHARTRERGTNPVVYWVARAFLQPFALVFWRLRRVGREHLPASGPVILASNHRSFLDPFVIGLMTRRPIYYLAKRELFAHRLVAWLLSALGAYPVERRASDRESLATTRALLERGEAVLIFPEGTRTRPGPLARPQRGVGRLALETGAPVVPIAIFGTDDVRAGWRIRPRRVSIRAGRALSFPRVERPSSRLAAAVTERIWPCVELQWEWLGGTPALRSAVVVGPGARTARLTSALTRAGLAVDVAERAGELDLAHHDLVCLLAGVALPAGVPAQTAVLALADGREAPSRPVRTRFATACADGARVALTGSDDVLLAQLAPIVRDLEPAVAA